MTPTARQFAEQHELQTRLILNGLSIGDEGTVQSARKMLHMFAEGSTVSELHAILEAIFTVSRKQAVKQASYYGALESGS